MDKKKHLSNFEWTLIIACLAIVDIAQIIIDLAAGAGVAINRFLDVAVGITLNTYLYIRGQDPFGTKKIMTTVATFIGEEVPILDALPLWVLDGVLFMSFDRASQKLENTNNIIVQTSVKAVQRMHRIREARLGKALPGGATKSAIENSVNKS